MAIIAPKTRAADRQTPIKEEFESRGRPCYSQHMTKAKDGLAAVVSDEEELIARILDVTERDSVIEGLPEFTPEFREELRAELLQLWRGLSVKP